MISKEAEKYMKVFMLHNVKQQKVHHAVDKVTPVE